MATQLVNIRSAFRARDGYVLCDVDYKQIENQLSAALAGEYPLLHGFQNGADFYKMIYRQMTGGTIDLDAITKVQRQIGKVVVLGQNYGQGVKSAARRLQRPIEETKEILASYWKGLPATTASKDRLLRRARYEGGLRTWFGRWRGLPDLEHPNREIQARAERQVWNLYIQGTAADWLKMAALRCDRALAGRDVHLLLTVHDELLFEVSVKEHMREVAWIIKDAMEFHVPDMPVEQPALYPSTQALYPTGFYVPVDMTWGFNWGEQHELEDKMVPDKKTKQEHLVKGFRTLAAERGLQLDFDTFEQPHPDYRTPRRIRTVPTARKHDDGVMQQIRDILAENEKDESVKEDNVARDPFAYPCVIVNTPPLTEDEVAFLLTAVKSLPGPDHLYLEQSDGTAAVPASVDGPTLGQYLRQLPRVGASIKVTRYDQEGREVRLSFAS